MPKKLHTTYATATVVFGLMSWVPLFNFFTTPMAIIFGIMSIYKINKYPKRYGGMARTVIGLVFAAAWLLMTIYALVTVGPDLLLKR